MKKYSEYINFKIFENHIEEYDGPDSLGYDKRGLEIKLSEIWQKKKLEIKSPLLFSSNDLF